MLGSSEDPGGVKRCGQGFDIQRGKWNGDLGNLVAALSYPQEDVETTHLHKKTIFGCPRWCYPSPPTSGKNIGIYRAKLNSTRSYLARRYVVLCSVGLVVGTQLVDHRVRGLGVIGNYHEEGGEEKSGIH